MKYFVKEKIENSRKFYLFKWKFKFKLIILQTCVEAARVLQDTCASATEKEGRHCTVRTLSPPRYMQYWSSVITVLENGEARGADKLCTESIIHLHTHILEIFDLELLHISHSWVPDNVRNLQQNLLGEVWLWNLIFLSQFSGQ